MPVKFVSRFALSIAVSHSPTRFLLGQIESKTSTREGSTGEVTHEKIVFLDVYSYIILKIAAGSAMCVFPCSSPDPALPEHHHVLDSDFFFSSPTKQSLTSEILSKRDSQHASQQLCAAVTNNH